MLDKIIQDVLSMGFSHEENLLNAGELKSIDQFFLDHKGEFKPAMVGKEYGKQRNLNIRGDYTYWLDPLDPPAPFVKIIQCLNSLKIRLNRELLLGIKEFECHLAYYPEGAFYKTHIDKFENTSTRIFSFIFYLNESWETQNGGELVIYSRDGKVLKTVSPTPGSFVGFLSEDFPHEVKVAKAERRSLTGWMRTKESL